MADEEHLKILREGVDTWNKWREDNPEIQPNLSKAYLSGVDLKKVNFEESNLFSANLENANLRLANLCKTNLERANLKEINLELASIREASLEEAKLEKANLVDTDLTDSILRDVNLNSANLNGANLLNTNLIRANLEKANLFDANFNISRMTYANFRDAYLGNADLSEVRALGTNFEGATLSGACIEDWNINRQTNLQNVKCNYIYLRQGKKDRRPHDPEKIFSPGEFTQLFQQALETVDLIFSDGIDWQAFLVSFNKLQIECGSDELSINSFENKGNGAFVIRVNVPDSTDKAEIEKYLKRQYQLEATVEAQQRVFTNLYEVTKLLAARPTNVTNQVYGNTYNTEKAGIVHNEDNISDNVKIAAEINEAPHHEAT